MWKRDNKGLETSEAIISKGIIRTNLTSISSICMTYAPFSYPIISFGQILMIEILGT